MVSKKYCSHPPRLLTIFSRILLAGVLIFGSLWGSMRAEAAEISQAEAAQRLSQIALKMAEIKLCPRIECRFSQIKPTITVAPAGSGATYLGAIDAIIDRPALTTDKAHYRFQFSQGRWQLLGGEEVSDVSSFLFTDDEYEVFSSYSGRTRVEKLQNAPATLRVGYRDLYLQVMAAGKERLAG